MSRSEDQFEAEFPAGHRLGRYTLQEAVGQGGMGTVYAAFDETTNRNVAIKILADGIPATLRERFLAECEAQAKIRHPHVMPVYDRAWLAEDRPYFTMELLYAPLTLGDLVAWTRDGSLSKRHPRLRHWADPVRLINDVILPAARGVAVANNQYRIQHRDIKPDNILVDVRTRRPYVIDFGICRPIDEAADEGKIVGTPRFLSTEQARGQVDARTDVWGIGALVHFVLTGHPPLERSSPFSRRDVDDRIAKLKEAERKAEASAENAKLAGYRERRRQLEDPDFRTLEDLYQDARDGRYLPLPADTSTALKAVVAKAMAPEPGDRYESVALLNEDLEAWIAGDAVQALSEAGTRGAAVDLARRTVRRHLVTGVGVTLALVIGSILGRLVFKEPPLRPDYRAQDIPKDVDILADEVHRAGNAGLDPATANVTWRRIHSQLAQARARALASDRAGLNEISQLEDLTARTPLEIVGNSNGAQWVVRRIMHTETLTTYKPGALKLEPGLYRVERRGNPAAAIPILVPFPRVPEAGAQSPVKLDVPDFPGDMPDGMVWVPGQVGAENGAATEDLLVQAGLVTCEQYGEWLDDLPASERNGRVPSEGFHQGDPSDSTRWLARREYQNRPVIGLSADAIEEYTHWRSDVHGVSLRLATDSEWQHWAGVSLLETPGAHWLLALQDGPFGVPQRRTVKGIGEVVRGPDGTLVVKTPDGYAGVLPMLSSFAHSEPYPDDGAGYGFRLVMSVD